MIFAVIRFHENVADIKYSLTSFSLFVLENSLNKSKNNLYDFVLATDGEYYTNCERHCTSVF